MIKICLISEFKAADSHGTGVLLRRYFENYPDAEILHLYKSEAAGTCIFKSRHVPGWRAFPMRTPWDIQRWIRSTVGGVFQAGLRRRQAKTALESFNPDIMVSVPYASPGIELTRWVAALFPDVPLYTIWWDYDPPSSGTPESRTFRDLMGAVLQRSARVEAISEPLREAVAALGAVDAVVDNVFCCEVPKLAVRNSIANCPSGVIMGNMYTPAILSQVSEVWLRVKQQVPDLKEWIWFCHPDGLRHQKFEATRPLPGIRYGGFLADFQSRMEIISRFDYSLIPFNLNDIPESNYARYSLPSRMTELCIAGLPIFAIAGSGTGVASYLRSAEIGMSHPCADLSGCAAALVDFLNDRQRLLRFGKNARRWADEHYPVDVFRRGLQQRIDALLLGRRKIIPQNAMPVREVEAGGRGGDSL